MDLLQAAANAAAVITAGVTALNWITAKVTTLKKRRPAK